jgi:HlyD family secretion protein
MKKWIISIIVVAALAGLGFLALEGGLLQATASEMAPKAAAVLPAVKAPNQIIAEAKVVPVRHAALSLPAGGVVAQVAVAEGESVQAGQVLVRVEAAQQAAAVAQAEAGLRRAQAQLDGLKAGPRPQEIAAAQAAVEGAQAQLAKITQSARPEEISAAEAALASAQASLNKVLKGPEEDEITVAAADLRRTEVALQQAQWAYDQIAYAANVGASPEAAKLEQATLDYKTAQARYHLAVRGPTDADVAAAKAQLALAEAALASLKGAREADVAAAQAEIHRAQAQLELLQAGARPEEVAAAEAEVAAAEATLAQAQAALTQTELRAPFGGTVAALDARVGEEAAAGAPLVRLADFTAWQVETDDLTELSVVQVKESAPVTITVDAITDLELPGHVLRVKGLGEDKQGDMTYTVIVQPDRPDERLRWNMTAAVFIEPR